MFLHQHEENFKRAVKYVAEKTGINPVLIEQDYFQMMLLRQIRQESGVSIVFNDSYSVQSTYMGIERPQSMLEIMLPLKQFKVAHTESKLFSAVMKSFSTLGLHSTLASTSHDIPVTEFWVDYPSYFCAEGVASRFLLRLSTEIPVFPTRKKTVGSILGKTLSIEGAGYYDFSDFVVKVASPCRVLIDRLFDLTEAYEKSDFTSGAFHLYELYCLIGMFDWDNTKVVDKLHRLYKKVLPYRMKVPEVTPGVSGETLAVFLHKNLISGILDSDELDKAYCSIPAVVDEVPFVVCVSWVLDLLESGKILKV